jgi:hypothetical protein
VKVTCRYDGERDVYELGAMIGGAFVAFYFLPGTTVRSRIEAVKSAESEQTEPAAA